MASVATGSRSKIPICSTTRVKSAIVFSLMIDGSSLDCRIIGRLRPVRIVTKRRAKTHQSAIQARMQSAPDVALDAIDPYRRSGLGVGVRPPVHMIKLTQEREITPYVWVHPDDDDRR
jgi:hypothetical protein